MKAKADYDHCWQRSCILEKLDPMRHRDIHKTSEVFAARYGLNKQVSLRDLLVVLVPELLVQSAVVFDERLFFYNTECVIPSRSVILKECS